MKRLLFLLLLLLPWAGMDAQMVTDAATIKQSLSNTEDGVVTLTFDVKLKNGWHIYDVEMPQGGPTATQVELDGAKGVKLLDKLQPSKAATKVYDPNFDMELSWHNGQVTFSQKVQIEDPANFVLAGDFIYMLCNDETCLPPTREAFKVTAVNLTTPLTMAAVATTSDQEVDSTATQAVAPAAEVFTGDIWKPVTEELKAYGDANLSATDNSLFIIFLLGFGGGLIALLTPCVWPMIPMTVSFFLKRSKSRGAAIRDALIYGAAIIVIYLTLGLLITAIFGANALNSLATNAIFNLIFFAMLVIFAVSFFGAFEIVLPQSWTNKMDAKAESTGGLISIFFMAFTLALVSFSCTGPIIGTLLVEAATSGSLLSPAVGMFGFALALALPFTLFAIFPNFLQSMPKSGGWMTSVKVTLGFLELALSLKFLSVADLAYGWGILDRETFLTLWIVIFALLGIYLLGKLKLPHDSDLPFVGIPRLFLAIISLAFAVYMVPGLWGAPLKAISAFAPPLNTQDFNLYDSEVHPKYHDYESAIRAGQAEHKPVLIDFSGYGCVNCREMEASVWTDPKVKSIIDDEFILVTLIVDDKTRLPEYIEVRDGDKTKTIKTVGERWSHLQTVKFGANAQPFYVMLDGNGLPLGPSYGFDKNVDNYVQWLKSGLAEYAKR
ncbi:MAG: cytochrome c biogenesis protein CcdA [Bacteroidales bacterium]|uniref:protein-disulfide reductase DsbD family protein n=1 Tax=Porphyromonas sp. TaxID=1924944 RepID=UPI002978983D|nr:cytochrome c biogenesis protein CcdA [Porphyromonas sp.]MDD7438726.1 cytochrome c biogenesis protein CcdA [Bacteroidales bacterium]MDY3066984.1 cytochrome c biogenesis protein CcdA [Porphyromonas sp.]